MNSKPILFVDFDGTICFDKYWRSLPPEHYAKVQEFIFGKDKTLLNNWMRGTYTAEEINKFLAEKTGIPFEELWELFVQDCKTMQVSQEILDKLSTLRNKYTVILVTGNMDSFTRFTVPVLGLEKYFDHINNSFFERKFKDDNGGEVFTKYAEALNISLKNSILLDDSAKACKTFENLGGTAYLITPELSVNHFLERIDEL